ncbi:MAG TPA: FAD-dependent oxidoreductase, partial [Streptomyces sp.]|nr:FAD-dependent oxidoreductase [Streptomyces sp.]
MPSIRDAVVVGAGPNGLTAAVELARRGFSVEVFEAMATVGGGARTEELTLPGFRHDPCSAVHPTGAGSPAFNSMPLEKYGLEWLHPELCMANPFPDGTSAVLARSVSETALSLGPRDAGTYRRMVEPFLGKWDALAEDFMGMGS